MFKLVIDGVGDYWVFKGTTSLGAASDLSGLFKVSYVTLAKFGDATYIRGQATWHDANSKWPQLKTLVEADSLEELEKLAKLEEVLGALEE